MRWPFPTPPSRLPCGTAEAHLSALLDDSLSGASRERLAGHAVHCRHCRRTLDDLRRTRALVRRVGDDAPAPTADLSQRLLAIAQTAPQPAPAPALATSTPSRGPVATLPRAAVVLAVLAVVTVIGVGWTNGPSPAAAVSDPVARARTAVAAAAASQPLGSSATAAALSVAGTPALAARGRGPAPVAVHDGRSLTTDELARLLRRSVGQPVAHQGRWQVDIRTDEGSLVAEVAVSAVPGQGTQFEVRSMKGTTIQSSFVADAEGSNPDGWDPGARAVDLQATDGQRIAGRSAVLVQTDPTAASQRRWWLDEQTGLLLHTELRVDGTLVEASGFSELRLLEGEAFLSHLQPPLTSEASASLSTSRALSLHTHGWFCQDRLAGLSLSGARADGSASPTRLTLTYSDTAQQVTVLQQSGTLPKSLPGYVRDPETGVLVRHGMPSVVTWQSGTTVFVVAGMAPSTVILDVVADLPHDPPAGPTLLDRIGAGWSRVGGFVFG
ncbi:MAG TPA: hypothetical protein IAA98_03255 [Candidatus Avipropionibacterium avicola]|uniref:MucB/RseB N-terminal domain-containing protein n=1 Tax=Candidatus Avipropionibacterium avicola TaxID=2840701 RepID=A0A9D1KLF0_9ACTN|nr:hypothetical protein [Candidatus Avipropionibacterium avicola]